MKKPNKITVEDALHTLEQLTPVNTGFKAICPNPDHDDKKLGNFYVSTEKGVMKCFSCGWGKSLFEFLIEAGVGRADAYDYYIAPKEKPINKKVELIIATKTPEEFLKRGFTEKTLKHFRVGYSEKKKRIEMPVYFDGELKGVVYRKKGKRLFSSDGFLMHEFIYNYEATEERYYTEGMSDTYRAYQNGTKNISATFGAAVTKTQLNLMKQHKVITLAYDIDEAGIKAMYFIYYALRRYVTIFMLPINADLGEKNDVGNCSIFAWKKAIKNKVPFVEFDINFQRAQPGMYKRITKTIKK